MASKVMAEEADMVDVLVIGAGPGGGSAAIHSARAGLKTVVDQSAWQGASARDDPKFMLHPRRGADKWPD